MLIMKRFEQPFEIPRSVLHRIEFGCGLNTTKPFPHGHLLTPHFDLSDSQEVEYCLDRLSDEDVIQKKDQIFIGA